MNLNPDDDGIILYAGRFFETRLQAGDPPEPPLIILSLATAETNQALVLTPDEMTELFLAVAATLAALAGASLSPVLPLLPGELAEAPPAAVVFPTRRST